MTASHLVLIVEDNESVAASLSLSVESIPGVRAVLARHPEQAMLIFQGKERISALLTDFGLPGMDGLHLISSVRALPLYSRLPVMMITAAEIPESIPCLGRPDAILPKPFSPKEVCRVLASLLR